MNYLIISFNANKSYEMLNVAIIISDRIRIRFGEERSHRNKSRYIRRSMISSFLSFAFPLNFPQKLLVIIARDK